MKKTVILALAAAALLLTGCDFFRSLAGRPTAAQLAAKRDSIAAADAAEAESLRLAAAARHRADSLAARAQFVSDSLAAEEALRAMAVMVLKPADLRGLDQPPLTKRYYVVVGSFREHVNAGDKQEQTVAAGYRAEVIRFRNGYFAVGAAGTDSVTVVLPALRRLRAEPFCPEDAWILFNP